MVNTCGRAQPGYGFGVLEVKNCLRRSPPGEGHEESTRQPVCQCGRSGEEATAAAGKSFFYTQKRGKHSDDFCYKATVQAPIMREKLRFN